MPGWLSRLRALLPPRTPSRVHACVRRGVSARKPAPPGRPVARDAAAEPLYPPEVYGFSAGRD